MLQVCFYYCHEIYLNVSELKWSHEENSITILLIQPSMQIRYTCTSLGQKNLQQVPIIVVVVSFSILKSDNALLFHTITWLQQPANRIFAKRLLTDVLLNELLKNYSDIDFLFFSPQNLKTNIKKLTIIMEATDSYETTVKFRY